MPTKKKSRVSGKQAFIKTLAAYLVGEQEHMSVLLEMGRPEAAAWARLRNATPLFGYLAVEEAEEILTEFLR